MSRYTSSTIRCLGSKTLRSLSHSTRKSSVWRWIEHIPLSDYHRKRKRHKLMSIFRNSKRLVDQTSLTSSWLSLMVGLLRVWLPSRKKSNLGNERVFLNCAGTMEQVCHEHLSLASFRVLRTTTLLDFVLQDWGQADKLCQRRMIASKATHQAMTSPERASVISLSLSIVSRLPSRDSMSSMSSSRKGLKRVRWRWAWTHITPGNTDCEERGKCWCRQNIAFIYDPDGYWIEILEQDRESKKWILGGSNLDGDNIQTEGRRETRVNKAKYWSQAREEMQVW